MRRGQDFSDPDALHALAEDIAVDRVAIAEEVRRRGVVREGIDDLLSCPGGGGMFRHVEVVDGAAVVRIITDQGRRLEGEYWTNRKSTGELRLRYESARVAEAVSQ